MNALERLKQLSTEVDQAITDVEAEERGGGTPAPTNYSSSVSSVSVDPTTGNVSVSLTLFPGDTPITPPPVEAEAPKVGAEAESTTVTAPDETEPQPGFTPAE